MEVHSAASDAQSWSGRTGGDLRPEWSDGQMAGVPGIPRTPGQVEVTVSCIDSGELASPWLRGGETHFSPDSHPDAAAISPVPTPFLTVASATGKLVDTIRRRVDESGITSVEGWKGG